MKREIGGKATPRTVFRGADEHAVTIAKAGKSTRFFAVRCAGSLQWLATFQAHSVLFVAGLLPHMRMRSIPLSAGHA